MGRDGELTKVVDALAAPPALVLVEGEAGIGKTRLLREGLVSPSLVESVVLVAACPPVAEPFPLGPVISGVSRLRPDVSGMGLSPLGGALRPLFPEWAELLPPAVEALEDPKETRYRIFRALTELVERLGVGILVVEDAHWSDAASLEWLLTLTAAEPAPWSVVVTYRPSDVAEGSLLPRLTSRVPAGMGHLRVELEPLDVADTRRLVESMLGADGVSEEFASFLYERTDGLPLAVEESVRLLRDRHDIIRRRGGWTRRVLDELQVPPTVRDSVLERVERLDSAARAILQAAAALAAAADAASLMAVAELDDGAGRPGLAAALASGLLQETTTDRYVFRHALDAQAIGDALPASERRHLHARAAAALATRQPPPVARLAHHYKEAGDNERWTEYAEASADLVLQSGDDHAAVTVLHAVLTAVDHPAERKARLARKLGQAAADGRSALGEWGHDLGQTLREVLTDRDIADGERGEIRLLLGRLLSGMDEPEAAFAEYEAAIPELDARPALAARAMLYLAWPLASEHPTGWHRAWLERASALLAHVESSAERSWCTASQATALMLLGDEAAWRVADDLPRSATTRLELRWIALGMLNVAQGATLWGRIEDARRRLAVADELVRSLDSRRCTDIARIAGAHLDWCTGAWDGLARIVEELAESEDARPATKLEARLIQGLLELARGERSSAERRLRDVMAGLARRGHSGPFTAPLASAALARIQLVDGDAQAALAVTQPEIATIAGKDMWVWAADIAPVHMAALVSSGQPQRAAAVVNEFATGLRRLDAPAPAAALVTCRAILAEAQAEPGVAAEQFDVAARAWAALPRPYDELLALERQGRCLLAAGEEGNGLDVLSDTEQRLTGLGARWDADRVAHVLREHGVEVTRVWRRGRHGYGDQLSPRELEVVELVAQGMTNKQIAEVLFLSFRTVERHLRNAMRKLDVSSRTALAMAATEAGLISSGGEVPE